MLLTSSFSSASCRVHPAAVQGQLRVCHGSSQPQVKVWQCLYVIAKATVINPAEARPRGDADLAVCLCFPFLCKPDANQGAFLRAQRVGVPFSFLASLNML